MKQKATVLFIDDEERILRALKLLFVTQYRVLTTTDGHEAIKIVQNEPVHAVISDQRMPAITGVETLREIKAVSPNTMRLLLTGYSDLAAIVGSVNEGEIFRYINKPWKNEELKATVNKAAEIGFRLMHAEAPKSAGADSPPTAKPEPETETENDKGPHLLLIDDEPETYQTVRSSLQEQYTLHWGKSLEEAFEILMRHTVAIVIADVRLGEEDISGALKELKRYNPDILTIVLSSFQDTKALIDLINHGQIYRFLPKPTHKGLLEKSISAALQHYRAIQLKPDLALRHITEKPKPENAPKLSAKLMGYLRGMRGRREQSAANS